MKFFGAIHNGEPVFTQTQRLLRQQYLEKLKDGTPIVEELVRYHKPKSLEQLGAWWGLFSKIILSEFDINGWDTSLLLRLDKPTGIGITAELLKEYMYSVCPIFDDSGKRIGMSKADTKQMAKFFDDCRNFSASQWSICVPEPRRDWRLQICEK